MAISGSQIRLKRPPTREANGTRVVVGFVNNMPDAAIRSAERQFRGLLQAGADDIEVVFEGFFCPEVPRTEVARTTFLQPYRDIEELWDSEIDGLIVTGAEPRADSLTEEPCWPPLARLTDWAEENTASTIWSCLAAHAAVYRLTGIARVPLMRKLSGLFECRKAIEHPLVAGAPQAWSVPHSRLNDLPEEDLWDKDFQPLTTLGSGLDTFIRQKDSLFVFFQGHPEYDPESLQLEYIRDVKRFLEGQRDIYPDPPVGYFDRQTLENLDILRYRAQQAREPELLAAMTRLLRGREIKNEWRSPSTIIYRNWITYLANKKKNASAAPAGALFQ
jgi:homoserine O-succinyltransferase